MAFSLTLEVAEMLTQSVAASFALIEAWLETHAPTLKSYLNPPATPEQISLFEKQLTCRLPDSVREAYGLHDGESSASNGLHGTWHWLPLAEVQAVIAEHRLIEAEYHFGDFVPELMIPIMQSGGGDLYYVESCIHPAAAAQTGAESEVIEWWHEQPTRVVIAPSFAGLWQKFAEDLETGAYVYRPDYLDALIEADELIEF